MKTAACHGAFGGTRLPIGIASPQAPGFAWFTRTRQALYTWPIVACAVRVWDRLWEIGAYGGFRMRSLASALRPIRGCSWTARLCGRSWGNRNNQYFTPLDGLRGWNEIYVELK